VFYREDILSNLKEMNAPVGGAVIVHTSMRAVGEVDGGAKGLLDCLIEYFTAYDGLLLIPTHTWDNLDNKVQITLDMTSDHTCLGALPTVAAGDPRGIRTLNPSHSVVIYGNKKRAAEFAAAEEKQNIPTSPKGCLGKLYELGGHILLIGVGHNRNTFIHCAEEIIGVKNRLAKHPDVMRIKKKDGAVIEKSFYQFEAVGIGDVSDHFPKYEPAFRYNNVIVDGKIGNANAQLCSAGKTVEIMQRIYKNSKGKELLCDDTPIDPAFYL